MRGQGFYPTELGCNTVNVTSDSSPSSRAGSEIHLGTLVEADLVRKPKFTSVLLAEGEVTYHSRSLQRVSKARRPKIEDGWRMFETIQ